MPTVFVDSTVTTGTECVAAIKQAVLRCSDWSHLQLTTGTQGTTLSADANAGAASISVATTIPAASIITIGNGSPNPEVRVTSAVSGTGPFTVSFLKPLAASYTAASAVGVGSIVKCVTTRGSQMVIDFSDILVTTTQMQIGIYRTHDGTTGVDKQLRYLGTKVAALTNPMRVRASLSKDHIYVDLEGPRNGEAGFDVSYGPYRSFIYMGDIVPYFAGDPVPAVVCIMSDVTGGTSGTGVKATVSRNQDNTDSWVPATILSLGIPNAPNLDFDAAYHNSWQQIAKGDGKTYLWPYVVVEDRHGLRGRIANVFNAGWWAVTVTNPQNWGVVPFALTEGAFVTYGGTTYRCTRPILASGNASGAMAFSATYAWRSNDYGPMLALPFSTP